MSARVVVLGAGTGGTAVANRLRRLCARSKMPVDITVIDSDDHHLYQPGLLFVPFGRGAVEDLTRSRRRLLATGIDYRTGVVDHVAIDANEVSLADGTTLGYDVLVVATGATLALEETEGLTGAGWRERVHTFYDADGATAMQESLAAFEGGRLVVNVIDMPIKCPVAPLEFCFLADHYFTRRGIRDRVELTYVTPLDAAFTKPVAAQHLSGLLE